MELMIHSKFPLQMDTLAMSLVNSNDCGHRVLLLISRVSAQLVRVLELWQSMSLIFQDSMRLKYWNKARFQRKFISEWMIDFGLLWNHYVYWRILKVNDFSRKLRILRICDIHTLFVRLVLLSHHNQSLSLSCGDLRLSVWIVVVILYQKLF
jgi:hypothetical protein